MPSENNRASKIAFFWLLGIGCGTVLLIASLTDWVRAPEKAEHCRLNWDQSVIPDRTADGKLQRVGDFYYVHSSAGIDAPVAARFPNKGGAVVHGPFSIVAPHMGQSIHVEFCGKTVTRLTFPEQDIRLPLPTQKMLDTAAERRKHAGRVLFGISVFMIAASVATIRKLTRMR